jgi:UDPglucose--hexose-1-phosphate uridylyltransferase
LIVTPVVPIYVQEEIKGAQEFYNYRGRNIFDDLIQQEISTGSRVVLDTPRFLVVCPYASRFPFETWIVPKRSCSHYENIQRQEIQELGEVLKNILLKMEIALDDPPFNFLLHTAPFDQKELPHYSWHIEIFPRLTRTAGFEWGSGFYINPVPPEEAASFLRKIEIPAEE